MKKTKRNLVLAHVLLAMVFIAGCGGDEPSVAKASSDAMGTGRFTEEDSDLGITTDMDTNCRYIIYNTSHGSSITPLLTPDGEPHCN